MKFSVQFLWYDLWVGAFWDRAKRTLYVCPLPCVVLKFDFRKPPPPWVDDANRKFFAKFGDDVVFPWDGKPPDIG